MDADTGDIRWMTYAELGQTRGISTASATRLAFRRKWRRQPGNDGIARVAVPVGEAQPHGDKTHDETGVERADTASFISALEAAIASLTEQAEASVRQADRAENRVDAAETRADRAENRADRAEQALADERNRADRAEQGRDALRDRLITMQEQLADAHGVLKAVQTTAARVDRAERDKDQAEAASEAERDRADALRDHVALLRAQLATAEAEAKAVNDRAWATGEQKAVAERRAEAERARAERAESGAAHERQDFLDAESRTRREMDGIRQRLERAEESRETAAELHRQIEAARIAQAQAEVDVAELRQAEAARQGSGRWARLRVAWRGL
jgi:hypothetical protein